MPDQSPLPPVLKLDAIGLVRRLNALPGIQLDFVGAARGGEVGAAFVRWPDGREGVLTRGPDDLAALARTEELLELARTHAIPCPRYDLVRDLPGEGVVVVQERLPGGPPRRIDDRLIAAMLAVNDRFAGLLISRPDVPPLDLYLTQSGPGFCLHESLERYDARTRRLLGWIREVGRHPSAVMTGSDLVHADLHFGNVLVDDAGAITGIVDWGDAGRGDRRFGLVTLAFDLGWGMRFSPAYQQVTPAGVAAVWARLDAMDAGILRAFWAHMSLRMVDWSIRHQTAESVDHYLAFASSRIGPSLTS